MGKLEMTGLADEIRVYCEANPRCNKVLVKVNHCYQSTGLALLTYPFNSLPDMYDNTRLISGNTTV